MRRILGAGKEIWISEGREGGGVVKVWGDILEEGIDVEVANGKGVLF
jgi:hypothetical protein